MAIGKRSYFSSQLLFSPTTILWVSRGVQHKEEYTLKLANDKCAHVTYESDGVDETYSATLANKFGYGPTINNPKQVFDAAKQAFQGQEDMLSLHGLSLSVTKPKGSLVHFADIVDPDIVRIIKNKYSPVKLDNTDDDFYTISHVIEENSKGKVETFKARSAATDLRSDITPDDFDKGSKTPGAKGRLKETYSARLLLGSVRTCRDNRDGVEVFGSIMTIPGRKNHYCSDHIATFNVVKSAYLIQKQARLASQEKPEERKK